MFITRVNLCIFSSAMDVFERNVFELSNCKHASASVLQLKLLTGPQVLNALEQSENLRREQMIVFTCSSQRLRSISRLTRRKKHHHANFESVVKSKWCSRSQPHPGSRKYVLRLLKGYYRVNKEVFAARLCLN